MKYVIAFVLPLFIMLSAIAAHGNGRGIVILPGYAHAVVVCGEATTINAGHESDPEIPQLLELAAKVCSTYQ